MSYSPRGVGAVLAIIAAMTTQTASAAIIDSTQAFVSTYGATHTDVVDGAYVSYLDAYNSSSVDVSGGHVSWLTLNDSASATISGGDISWLRVFESSTASLTGVDDLSWLVVSATAHVDIYANNVSFRGGLLSGAWFDGSLFEFWAVLGSAGAPATVTAALPSNITIRSVPEPATALLLGLGLIGIGVSARSRSRHAAA